jgi:hypothetical protein
VSINEGNKPRQDRRGGAGRQAQCKDLLPLHVRAEISSATSFVFNVPEYQICGKERGKARVSAARQAAIYLAHVGGGLPQRSVARLFRRDRTTVAHACAATEDRRDDPCFDLTLAWLEFAMKCSAMRLCVEAGR